MSRAEFIRWWEFHKRNPIDPVSLHQKPAALIAYTVASFSQQGTKHPMDDFLASLVPPNPDDEAWAVFRAFLN